MGAADIVPGVSGGTIALITGIYLNFINAIRSIDIPFFKKLFQGDLKGAAGRVHIRFLVPLAFGIGLALISLAQIIHYALAHWPDYIWSFFAGLIAASIIVVVKQVKKWSPAPFFSFATGAAGAFLVIHLIPLSTPQSPLFIFIAGFVAICAMILPGISGAFILVILGKYEFMTGILRNPFAPGAFLTLSLFALGCFSGMFVFSRALRFLLNRYHDMTHAFLGGIIASAMTKAQILDSITAMVAPFNPFHPTRAISIESMGRLETMGPLMLLCLGFVVVIALEKTSKPSTNPN